MDPIRVVLVDDSLLFLDRTIKSLWAAGRFEIVGCSLSGKSAVEQVEDLRPDLVLMGLVMPDMNGLEATHRIKEQVNPPRVVILSPFNDPEFRAVAADPRADGYLTKDEFHTQLLPVVLSLFQESAGVGA